MNLSLTESAVRTQRLSISIPLTALAALFDLSTVSFRAQVRSAAGSPVLLYEWKSGGSDHSPGSTVSYEPTSKVLTLVAPSEDMLDVFSDDVMPSSTTIFKWELGFFLPDSDDFRGIGLGDFPVQKGVFRP